MISFVFWVLADDIAGVLQNESILEGLTFKKVPF